MDPGRLREILSGVVVGDGEIAEQLCAAFTVALPVTGCGVALIRDGQHHGSLGSSGAVAARGEELQFSLGEGPGIDACRQRAPVVEAHLATAGPDRWMAFAEAAPACGIAAVFAVPLGVGVGCVGALTVYQRAPGALGDRQFADLLVLAEVTTQLVLALQANADPGALAAELADVGSYRPEVHQATGMVSARLNIPVIDALVRLRGYAYANDQTLADVSHEVVVRRLRLVR